MGKAKKTGEGKTVMDELSQATAAVLRQQMLQNNNTAGTSVLEGIKIMERRQPSEKFTGEDKKIDFDKTWPVELPLELANIDLALLLFASFHT